MVVMFYIAVKLYILWFGNAIYYSVGGHVIFYRVGGHGGHVI